MRYLDSYRFPFRSPNWMTNILCVTVCFLIPAVGSLILMGYMLELIEWLDAKKHRGEGSEAGYPDFNFNRFGDYLSRGVWPFLVSLVISLPLSLFVMVLGFVGMTVAAASGSGTVAGITFAVLGVVFFAGMVAVSLVHVPLYLRAGLTRDFATGFSIAFVKDFLRRVGKEVALSQLFLMATAWGMTLVGTMLLCVGLYPAMTLVVFAVNHQAYLLYELYLERGGEPIPLPVQAVTAGR